MTTATEAKTAAQLKAEERIAKIQARLDAARAAAEAATTGGAPRAPKTQDPVKIAERLSATLGKAIKSVENSKRLLGWILKENPLNWPGMTADNGPWLDAVLDEYRALKKHADGVVSAAAAPAAPAAEVADAAPAAEVTDAAPAAPAEAPAPAPTPRVVVAKKGGKVK